MILGRVQALCLAATLLAGAPSPVLADILEPPTALRTSSESVRPPPDDAAWVPVRLPENRGSFRLITKVPAVWYRIEFDVSPDMLAPASWAIYVPYLLDGGHLFLNGQAVAHIAEPSEELRVKWERPHLLPVPEGSVRAGRNVLMVRTQPTPDSMSLEFPRIAVGPTVELLPDYERRRFWVRTVPQLTTAFCTIGGLFVLFVWLLRRSDVIYGIFALTVLTWGARTLTFVIETLPSDEWLAWRFFYLSGTGAFIGLLTVFTLRFARVRLPWFERLLFAYWLIAPVAMIATGGAADGWLDRVWRNGWAALTLVMLAAAFTAAFRQRNFAAYCMLLGTLLAVGGGIHDTILYSGTLAKFAPEWAGHRIYLMHHGLNALLVMMGLVFTHRFAKSLSEVEELNHSLEARVAAREAELARNYKKMSLLEGERAALDERKRIMQDIHDGLGSQLFTSLSRAQRSALTREAMIEALSDCIAEMRLALEASTPDEQGFVAALADFRYRWEAQLETAGMQSTWQLDPALESVKLAPHVTLQVLRILQEALTNALKHSGASRVRVGVHKRGDGALRLEVEDDGRGAPERGDHVGRGLENMRARAQRLGSALQVDFQPGRTLVGVDVPCPAPAP